MTNDRAVPGARVSFGVLVVVALVCAVSAAAEDFGPVRLRQVSDWKSPALAASPDGRKGGSANSFVLRRQADDGPVIAVPWHTSYEDCTTVFYNLALEPIATWRDGLGEQVMNVTDGDLDGDGQAEILLTLRMRRPGVVALRWNAAKKSLDTVWEYRRDTHDCFHRGSAIGQFTEHAGREVVFGSSRGELLILDRDGKLLATRTLDPHSVIQRIDTIDVDADGYDEMVIATGRNPGRVWLVRWNPQTAELEVLGNRVVTPEGRGGDNCYEAVVHAAGHPAGGPAIAAVTEREHDPQAGSFLLLDMQGDIVWQDVFAPEDRRAGGCDFRDVTGDDVPEIVGRSTGPHRLLIYSNRGERIGAITNCRTGSAGPAIIPREGKPPLVVATSAVYEVVVRGASERRPWVCWSFYISTSRLSAISPITCRYYSWFDCAATLAESRVPRVRSWP